MDWFARRSGGADRKAERAVAGQCAGCAASDTALAEDQCPAGSRREGGATHAAERCGITRYRQSEREACAGRVATAGSRRGDRLEARDRCDRSCRRPAKGRSPAAQRRRAAKARGCDCSKTSIAA